MNEVAIFLSMIILHIIDDFKLQGILADFKQISWWKKMLQIDFMNMIG